MEITFLHLSDLHIEKKHLADIRLILDALWKDITNQNVKIDFVIFNGDLIKHGDIMEEYVLATENFINPLLRHTSLTNNDFFMVPGNHEVNRKKIKEFIDGDLTSKFNERDKLNNFIDNLDENDQLLARMEDYNTFIDQIKNPKQGIITENKLYSTYIIPKYGKSVGIACLNTAWGAVGGENDYGKILLGERQIDNAFKDISQCDLKIALFHHPLEWLKEFDRESIYDRILTDFDLVFNGHLHTQNYRQMAFNNHKAIFLKSASLFQGRTINGYSIVKANLLLNEVEVTFREYFEGGRRAFGKAERVAENGHIKLALNTDEDLEVVKKNFLIKKTIKSKVYEEMNKELISVYSDSIAPKDINGIFVNPIISKEPESSVSDKKQLTDEEEIDLNVILKSESNTLLIGKKEIGKTTILNYICNYFLNKIESKIVPVIIDFNELPKGKNVVQKAIQNFFVNYDVKDFDLESNIEGGNLLLLIDNFNLNNIPNLDKIRDFFQRYTKSRVILAMNENLMQTIKISEIPDLGFKYEKYYIYSFRRGQIRQLVNNWFSLKSIDNDLILDRVLASIKAIGVPRTPMVISLMLWVLEKQVNFVPVNEAALVENYIQNLLEKLNIEDTLYETIGYSIKQDFLTYLAIKMVGNVRYYFEKTEFEELFLAYFKKIGLETKENVKQSFFQKGILIIHETKVYFRFRCFYEYFLALGMTGDQELYDFVMHEDKYVDFINEIIFYCGLNQKKNSYLTLKKIESRLLASFREIDELIDLEGISQLPIKEYLFEALNKENISEKLKEIKLSDEEKDIILDSSEPIGDELHLINKETLKKEELKEKFVKDLQLYANILKNCELVDIDLKVEALGICINKFAKIIGLFYKLIYSKLFDSIEKDTEDLMSDDELVYFITVGVTIATQTLILTNLGTPKLKVAILEQLKLDQSEFEKLILICLYADMRLEGYINHLDGLFKNTKSKFIKEIIFNKYIYYKAVYNLSHVEEQRLDLAISGYVLEKQGGGKKQNMSNVKSKVLNEIKKKTFQQKNKRKLID